jgi:hypothetical protein
MEMMFMSDFKYYYDEVETSASDFVDEYIDETIQRIKDGDIDPSDFLNDEQHNFTENKFIHTDIVDHAHIIKYSNEVETDSGLWEGLEPQRAIESMAYFTFRNDLRIEAGNQMRLKLEEVNEELEEKLDDVIEKYGEDSDEYYEASNLIDNISKAISNI